jgi:hypothetical protein
VVVTVGKESFQAAIRALRRDSQRAESQGLYLLSEDYMDDVKSLIAAVEAAQPPPDQGEHAPAQDAPENRQDLVVVTVSRSDLSAAIAALRCRGESLMPHSPDASNACWDRGQRLAQALNAAQPPPDQSGHVAARTEGHPCFCSSYPPFDPYGVTVEPSDSVECSRCGFVVCTRCGGRA